MSNTTGEAVYSYPPLPACWNITNQPCPATMDMLTFFNISSQNSYYQYYCLNPPQDSCEFGYCPNADVAGLYVRVSTYVTNVCLALLILYSPDEVATTFYAQILSVYSLVITTFISIADHSLTRLHGTYALITAGSPLSITLAIYALRSLFQKDTRMHAVYGKGRERWWINRILVLLMIPCWIGILVYLSIATKHGSLSQVACDSEGLAQDLLIFMFIIPVVPFVFSVEWGLIGLIPWFILIVSWITCTILRRKAIWAGNGIFPVWRIWRVVCDNYPFLHFITVVVLPFSYWIVTLEIGADLQIDNGVNSQATFGQILAVSVAVPPFISFLYLLPRLPRWFWNLAWVRFLTCRVGERRSRSASIESLGKEPVSHNQWGVDVPLHSPRQEYGQPPPNLGHVETQEYTPLAYEHR